MVVWGKQEGKKFLHYQKNYLEIKSWQYCYSTKLNGGEKNDPVKKKAGKAKKTSSTGKIIGGGTEAQRSRPQEGVTPGRRRYMPFWT